MFMWGWHWGWGSLSAFVGSAAVLVIFALPWVFFLLTLRGLLEKVSEPNRAMAPDHVWLNFIPVFNLGWYLYTVMKVRDSVRAEYNSRGWQADGDLGYNVGLASGVLGICGAIFGWFPVIGWGVAVAALITWIVYWMKAAELSNTLVSGQQRPGTGYPPPYNVGPQGPWPVGGQTPPGQQMRWSPPPVAQTPATPPPAGTAQPAGDRAGAASEQTTAAAEASEAKRCAVCDTTVAPDDKFCRGCGLPLP
jgi:hypothetical protein